VNRLRKLNETIADLKILINATSSQLNLVKKLPTRRSVTGQEEDKKELELKI